LSEAGKCPRCKLIAEETARDVKARQDMQEASFREMEETLGHGDE
jgi:phage FluMu protein Com